MTKIYKIIAAALAVAAIGGVAGVATAQNAQVSQAISGGVVGETASGYLGFAQTPSAELRSMVDAINIQRRSAYSQIGERRGVTRDQVAGEAACTQFGRLSQGQAYQLSDGVWRTKGSAAVSC